jgi:hypothetical protein
MDASSVQKWHTRISWLFIGTLISTVVSLAAQYINHKYLEKPEPAPQEAIYFSSLPADKNQGDVYRVKYGNQGTKYASDVRVSVSYPKGAKLKNVEVNDSVGRASNYELSKFDDGLVVHLPTLVPHESGNALISLDGQNDAHPLVVEMRSSETIAADFNVPAPPVVLSVKFDSKPWIDPSAEYPGILLTIGTFLLWIIFVLLDEKTHRKVRDKK